MIIGGSVDFPLRQVHSEIITQDQLLWKTDQHFRTGSTFADGGKMEICGSSFLSCHIVSFDVFYGFKSDHPTQMLAIRTRKIQFSFHY